ncbi:MAG: hypothetical protein ACREAE_05050 [Nitrosopumilaceae archaeon]
MNLIERAEKIQKARVKLDEFLRKYEDELQQLGHYDDLEWIWSLLDDAWD